MKKKNKKIEYNLNDFDSSILKDMNDKELAILSDDIRKLIIDKCSKYGGHLSSNLGVVESIVALHKEFDFPKDKIIFDVGHQSYTHKILSKRPLENLRQENGTDGFQKRLESVYDCYDAGHSSTSISAAMGLAAARDLNNEDYNIIAFIGDSSISNGLSFEALNNLGVFNHKVIIILNDNDMAISKTVGGIHNMLQNIRSSIGYSKAKSRFTKLSSSKIGNVLYKILRWFKNLFKKVFLRENFFENLDLYYIGQVNGYNFKKLKKAFTKAKKSTRSTIIHIKTIKGKGYKYSEMDCDGFWHGVKPFDINTGKELKPIPEGISSWSKVYARLVELGMKKDDKMLLINPATTIGSYLRRVMQENKERSFDVGISEEHAIVLANGMAVGGFHPYISIYSTFLQRGYDQVNHDIARMNSAVTILVDRAGLVGSDGETHQGIFDVAMFNHIPNISIAMAKDQQEALDLFNFSLSYNNPLIIRYPNTNTPYKKVLSLDEANAIEYGKWKIEKKSTTNNIAVIATGPKLVDLINKYNDSITIVNPIFQTPIDIDTLKSLLSYSNIIIYDAYSVKEGFAIPVQAKLIELGYKGNIHTVCIKNEFVKCGTIEEQEKREGVSLDDIYNLIDNMKAM